MSSLWTPGGEVPVNRESARPAPGPEAPAAAPGHDDVDDRLVADDEAIRAQIEAMQAQMLQLPAAEVVVEHIRGLYELAVLHLSQEAPKLAEARLAIDAVDALVTGLAGRLGAADEPLAQMVGQLKMAFVQVSGQADTSTD